MKRTFLHEYYNEPAYRFDKLKEVKEWRKARWVFREDDGYNILGYNILEKRIMVISYDVKIDAYSLPIYIKFDFIDEYQIKCFQEDAAMPQ